MSAPRLEIDLDKLQHNAETLVTRLAGEGISVTGVTKATLGCPEIASAFLRGGVRSLADSRVENIEALHSAGIAASMTLIRPSMPSQAQRVVMHADMSFNTELETISGLSAAAQRVDRNHGIVLVVELGDLREGIMPVDLLDTVRTTLTYPNLVFKGIAANLACVSGVAPDTVNMSELSALAHSIDAEFGPVTEIVSGGNSANLQWAFGNNEKQRINDLRLGEAILLGCETLAREPIEGLHTDAFVLVSEVIESKRKPSLPWGNIQQAAFGPAGSRIQRGEIAQTILAIGCQDTDTAGLTPPAGVEILAASSDQLVVYKKGEPCAVGSEIRFRLNYGALLLAMTSPFVAKVLRRKR